MVWQKGLLKKGNGLCHGITGNGFSLHSLYRGLKAFGHVGEAEEWRARAWTFAKASVDPKI